MLRLRSWLAIALVATAQLPSLASTPVRLNSAFNTQGNVSTASLAFSPDGEYVLYLANPSGATEAFVVPTSGGASIKVNGHLVSEGAVSSAMFSADGSRVLYRAKQDHVNRLELFSTAIGETPAKVNLPLPDYGAVTAVQISPAGHVVYSADQDTASVVEAFVAPIDGSDPYKLNGPFTLGGDVHYFDAESADDTLVYVADQEFDARTELYAASLDGSLRWKLSGEMQLYGNVDVASVNVSPTGDHVVYRADALADEVYALFSVPIGGGAVASLTPTLANGGDVISQTVQISPLGDRVLYLADQLVDETIELFSVSITGGPAARLNGPLVNGGDVRESSLQFSDDGTQVLYIADQFTNEKFELFVAPTAGGDSQHLNGSLISGGDVDSAAFNSTGEWVVYLADQNIDSTFELFSAPTAGGDAIRLNSPLVYNGDVLSFEITPDGEQVIFLADLDLNETSELYAVPIGGGDVRKLSGPLVRDGDVTDFIISPNSDYIVYRADQLVNQQFELFSVPLFESIQTLPGDFNFDGMVDAADYTAWRDGLGSDYDMDDYADWKNNFGANSTSGNAAAATVPESASGVLLVSALACFAMLAQSRKSCSANRAGTYSSVT
jgi:Tol biopolymer transport system component